MRRFLTRAALFFLSTLLIATALNFIAPNRDDTVVQVRTLVERGPEIEAVALGNSHSLAIDFDALGYEGYHLWRGNGDALEAQHQMQELLADLPNLELALMPVSLFTVHADNGLLDIRDEHRQIHYTASPAWTYIEGDWENFLLGKAANFPLWRMVRVDHWEGDLRNLASAISGNDAWRTQEQIVTQADNIRFILRNPSVSYYECDYFTEEELLVKAMDEERSRALEAVAEQRAMLAADPSVAERTFAALAALHEQLARHDVRLVFYTPPYAEIYIMQYDPAFIIATGTMMEQLQALHGVEYYDFSSETPYTLPVEHMLDEDHLNYCGAKIFSERLRVILHDRPAEGH